MDNLTQSQFELLLHLYNPSGKFRMFDLDGNFLALKEKGYVCNVTDNSTGYKFTISAKGIDLVESLQKK